jgi:undecaprenyl-diphosphatase
MVGDGGPGVNLVEGVILGVVQGLTEFLPVSSSGHLVLVQHLFGLLRDGVTFEVVVHAATLLAIVVYFRRAILARVRRRDGRYLAKLVLATLPIAVVGVLAGAAVERVFGSPLLTAGFLAFTGVVLLSRYIVDPVDRHAEPDREQERDARLRGEPTWTDAWWIGCAQAVAILPGVSRSGMTIVAGVGRGLRPVAAAEFSFLLGVPAIFGALLLRAGEVGTAALDGGAATLLAGAAAAFVSGTVAIGLVLRLMEHHTFRRFGFYCVAIGAAFAAYLLLSGNAA